MGMSEKDEGETFTDLPLDFTQFLSGRLGLDASATLSTLGSYLLSFEPRGEYSSRVAVNRSSPPADCMTLTH